MAHEWEFYGRETYTELSRWRCLNCGIRISMTSGDRPKPDRPIYVGYGVPVSCEEYQVYLVQGE